MQRHPAQRRRRLAPTLSAARSGGRRGAEFFFVFPTRLFLQHVFAGVGVGREGPHRCGGARLAGGGAIPAAIGQDLVQLRHGIIAVALQLEQGRCERALGRNGQERPCHPGGLSRWSEVRWDGGGSVAGQKAQEGVRKVAASVCFGAKAPTHFQANDDQAAPLGTEELGVRAVSLAPRCCSLRQQQRTGRKGEVRKMRLARALVARSGSLALPSPQGITWLESAAARWRRV